MKAEAVTCVLWNNWQLPISVGCIVHGAAADMSYGEGVMNGRFVSDLTLLAGLPGAGKSHFGRWSESTSQVLHIDLERDGRLESMNLRPTWDHFFATGDPTQFVRQLRELRRPILLNWGFPPHCLAHVRLLKNAGFSTWWFSGDLEGARIAFNRRGDVPPELFDVQVPAITANWPAIEQVFTPNVLEVVDRFGNHMEPGEIFAAMLRSIQP